MAAARHALRLRGALPALRQTPMAGIDYLAAPAKQSVPDSATTLAQERGMIADGTAIDQAVPPEAQAIQVAATGNANQVANPLPEDTPAASENTVFTEEDAAAARTLLAPEPEPRAEIKNDIDAAAHEAATSPLNDLPQPTEAQKAAENYKVGRVRLHGLDISIENPRGSVRSGVSPDGTRWQNRLAHHYGRILGSTGNDGDHVDVFLTDGAEDAPVAWVIDQKNNDGSFDEHKAVIGPRTEAEARAAYLANYDAGWDGLGAITSMPMEAFRAWVLDGKTKRKPLAYVEPQEDATSGSRVDYKGFERVPLDNGAFELRDGNMVVRVVPMGYDKFQASFRSAKSSPHLQGEQGAVDWAVAYRDDLRAAAGDAEPKAPQSKHPADAKRPDSSAGSGPAGATPLPVSSVPFASFKQMKTALKIVGDVDAIKARLRNLNVAFVVGNGFVNVPNKLRWNEVLRNVPVRIDTYHLDGVPARFADVTVEVMESGEALAIGDGTSVLGQSVQEVLDKWVDAHNDAPAQTQAGMAEEDAAQSAPQSARHTAPAVAARGGFESEVQDQLARFELGEFGRMATDDAAYREAARRFLEGDLKTRPPKKRDRGIYFDGLENISPRPIKKSVTPAKTADEQISAVRVIGGQGDVRYYLNGVHIEHDAGRIVATDGYRMAVVEGVDLDSANLPARQSGTVTKNAHTVLGDDGRWIDGVFPDWSRVMPDSHAGQPAVFSAERVSGIARGIEKAMRYADHDRDNAFVRVEMGGGSAFLNASYLADAADLFRRMGYDKFLMSKPDKVPGPVFMSSPDGRVRQVIMPGRVSSSPFSGIEPDPVAEDAANQQGKTTARPGASEKGAQKAEAAAESSSDVVQTDGSATEKDKGEDKLIDRFREASDGKENGVLRAERDANEEVARHLGEDRKARAVQNAVNGDEWGKEKYAGPANVSSRAGQMELAYRASRIASLQAMNRQLRAVAPEEAWADEAIAEAADLDALQDAISAALVAANRTNRAESNESAELRKRLEEASGAEVKAVFNAMGLSGKYLLHTEIIEMLMREDAQKVSAALDSVLADAEAKPAQQEQRPDHASDPAVRRETAPETVVIPPGKFAQETVTITKRGRKWLEGRRQGKAYTVKIEINDASRDFEPGKVYTFPAKVETKTSGYGTSTVIYPLTAEQAETAKREAERPELLRWLGYVEDKAPQGYVYQNGVQKLQELGIAKHPDLQSRLDAAIAKARQVAAEQAAQREANRERAWSERGKTRANRMLYPLSAPPVLNVPVRLGDKVVVFAGRGEPFRISDDHPSVFGSHLLGHEGERGAYFYFREAAADEVERLEQAEAKTAQSSANQRRIHNAVEAIKARIQKEGERPEGMFTPQGRTVLDTSTAYGGGDWFVIGDDAIWYVRNNGGDGDNWSENNVRTGGAGAIGWKIPFDAGIAAELDVLDGEVASLRSADPDPAAFADGAITRAQADGFVRDFVARFPAAPKIVVVSRFDQLPAKIQQDARQQNGGERSVKGAFSHRDGRVYIVAGNHRTLADLEATVLHETIGHAGVRRMFGQQWVQQLNRLYIALGGDGGIIGVMLRRGMGDQLSAYYHGIAAARKANPERWSDDLARAVLTEEVLAHIAEQQGRPGLRDRFMTLVGAVRQWLRDMGFAKLAAMGESDLLFILSRARAEMRRGDTSVVREGVETGPREWVTEDGRAIPKDDPDYAHAVRLAKLLGLEERSGTTVFRFDDAEIERQFADTERAYGGREAFERARADGRTKLGYRQWVQVRTPAFKQWFGDWELASLGTAMRRVRGSDQAKAVRGEIVGKPLTNAETGIVATVSGESFGKMLSSSNVVRSISPQAHYHALGNLDKLFHLATLDKTRSGKKEHDATSINAVHHFVVPMPFDGDILQVKLLVKEFKQAGQGSRIYLVQALEIETPASERGDSTVLDDQTRLPHPPAGVSSRLAEMVAAVKGDGVSKVVDPDTGEPLVVYHGTFADFSAFDAERAGENTDGNASSESYAQTARVGFWFNTNPMAGDKASYTIDMPVFLAIKNPNREMSLDWLAQGLEGTTGQAYRDDLIAEGYDGIVLQDEEMGGTSYVAFRPEQIKSATGNIGAFDPTNPSILASRKGAPKIDTSNRLTALFTALAQFDDAFQRPTPKGKTVEAIAQEVDPGYRAKAMPSGFARQKTKGRATRAWEISVPASGTRAGYLFEDDRGRVWIDVSQLRPGIDAGNVIYGIAAGYAYNTGKVFIGDPEGLSPMAFFRRLENMISSALRYGTTDHLYPHAAQVDPVGYYTSVMHHPDMARDTKGLGLDWKEGDFTHNLTEMMRVSYNAAIRFAPELQHVIYDFDSRQFIDERTGERRSGEAGERLAQRLSGQSPQRYLAGSATQARAALINTLVRRAGKEDWRKVMAALVDQLHGRGLDYELDGIFYKRDDRRAQTHGLTAEQFRAALVERFGESGVAALEAQGLLNIAQADTADPLAGWYDPESRQAFFVPELIGSADEAVALVLHEVGEHHGLESMLGPRGWRTLKARIAGLAREGKNDIRAAWDGVIDNYPEFRHLAGVEPGRLIDNDRFMHEVIAKIGETAAGRKSGLWRDLLAAVNRFLLKMGIGRQINKNELADLVAGSLKRAMGGKAPSGGPRGGVSAPMKQRGHSNIGAGGFGPAVQSERAPVGSRAASGAPTQPYAGLDHSVAQHGDDRVMPRRPFDMADYMQPGGPGRKAVRTRLAEAFESVFGGDSAKTFNWWNRTLGSQFHKAKKSPEFARVYEIANAFIDDVSRFANRAADRARGVGSSAGPDRRCRSGHRADRQAPGGVVQLMGFIASPTHAGAHFQPNKESAKSRLTGQ